MANCAFLSGHLCAPRPAASSACAVTWESGEFFDGPDPRAFSLRPDGCGLTAKLEQPRRRVFSYADNQTGWICRWDPGLWNAPFLLPPKIDKTAVWLGVPGFPRAEAGAFLLAAAAPAPWERHGPDCYRAGPASSARHWGGALTGLSTGKVESIPAGERNPHYFGAPENQPAFDHNCVSCSSPSAKKRCRSADGLRRSG